MAINEKKMQIVIDNYFKSECNVDTSIRDAFEKGFRNGVKKTVCRPKGEWVFHVSFSDESQRDDYDLICTNCGELYRCDCQDDVNDFVWNAHYCMNCGAYMGGDNGTQKHL